MRKTILKKRPMVSVLMCAYNAEKYIEDSIKSILSQTVRDFEFFILDDGSTDKTFKIIDKYAKKDNRIRVFRNKQKKGLVLSLNFLIPKTRGIYVARMDADDVSLPLRFEKQIQYLEENTNVVACGAQEYIISEDGEVVAEKYFPTDSDTCYNSLMNFMVIQPPLLMARGEAFRRYKYDNHTFKNDDITMHFKLLRSGDFGNVDMILFKYRKLTTSLTHKDPKQVYFLALKARIRALLYEDYRPSLQYVVLAVFETMIVSVLPAHSIDKFFEFLRYKKKGVIPRFFWGLISV